MAEYTELDRQVREWFASQGWPVTATHYDFDREIFAWRHEARPSYTLRISRVVQRTYGPGCFGSF